MRVKALLIGIFVVVGAVLPYLLADEKFVGKINEVLTRESQSNPSGESGSTPDALASVSSAEVPKPIQPPVGTLPPTPKNLVDGASAPLPSMPAGVGGLGTAYPLPPGERATQRGTTLSTSRRELGPNLTGPRGVPMGHLLSFEVTPEWVSENWSRITTQLSELELQGWRVPVALQDEYDLIGSVTYFFDRQKTVQRIVLHGFTTNPRQIIQLAQTRYQMRRVPNYLVRLYVYSSTKGPLGGLRVIDSSIRKSRGKSQVLMELNRQETTFGMSYEFEKILRETRERDQTLSSITGDQEHRAPVGRTDLQKPLGRQSNTRENSRQPGFHRLPR